MSDEIRFVSRDDIYSQMHKEEAFRIRQDVKSYVRDICMQETRGTLDAVWMGVEQVTEAPDE